MCGRSPGGEGTAALISRCGISGCSWPGSADRDGTLPGYLAGRAAASAGAGVPGVDGPASGGGSTSRTSWAATFLVVDNGGEVLNPGLARELAQPSAASARAAPVPAVP